MFVRRQTKVLHVLIVAMSFSLGCSKQEEAPSRQTQANLVAVQDDASKASTPSPESVVTDARTDATRIAVTPGRQHVGFEDTPVSYLSPSHIALLLFGMLLALLLLLVALLLLLKLRRVTRDGMMALTPVSLLDSLAELSKRSQDEGFRRFDDLQQRLFQALMSLDMGQSKHEQSVRLLDAELTKKDLVISRLSEMVSEEQRDRHVRTLLKLAAFTRSLHRQVSEGRVAISDAMEFLSDELVDSLVEGGVEIYRPRVGQRLSAQRAELCELVHNSAFNDSASEDLVVVEVTKVGVFRTRAHSNELVVYQKAEVELGRL